MKKAMLFAIALFFSAVANAATFNLTGNGASNASQSVDISNGSVVLASGTATKGIGTWESWFNVVAEETTPVVIEWSFNPTPSIQSAKIAFGVLGGTISILDISSDFSFTAVLTAGLTYVLDIYDATRNVYKYDLSVSAVPIPAALFLLAPALLGFLGLRKKAIVA